MTQNTAVETNPDAPQSPVYQETPTDGGQGGDESLEDDDLLGDSTEQPNQSMDAADEDTVLGLTGTTPPRAAAPAVQSPEPRRQYQPAPPIEEQDSERVEQLAPITDPNVMEPEARPMDTTPQGESTSTPLPATTTKSTIMKEEGLAKAVPDVFSFVEPETPAQDPSQQAGRRQRDRARSSSTNRGPTPPTPRHTSPRAQSAQGGRRAEPLIGLKCKPLEVDKTRRQIRLNTHTATAKEWQETEMSEPAMAAYRLADINKLSRSRYELNMDSNVEQPDQEMEAGMQQWFQETGGIDTVYVNAQQTKRLTHVEKHGVNITRSQQDPPGMNRQTIHDRITCCTTTATELSRWDHTVKVSRQAPPTHARQESLLPQAPDFPHSSQTDQRTPTRRMEDGVIPEMNMDLALQIGFARPTTIIRQDMTEGDSMAQFLRPPIRCPDSLSLVVPFVHPMTPDSDVKLHCTEEWPPLDKIAQTRYRADRNNSTG